MQCRRLAKQWPAGAAKVAQIKRRDELSLNYRGLSSIASCVMANLPREIWILVYILCDDIQTAVYLAATSKELRTIWLDKHEYIAATILKPDISAYDEAVRVAKLETRRDTLRSVQELGCAALTDDMEATVDARYRAPLWLPRLLKNARLAILVSAEWDECLDHFLARAYRNEVDLSSPTIPTAHNSYYLVRELIASYHMSDLRPALESRLQTCPEDALRTYSTFCYELMSETLSTDMDKEHGVQRLTPVERRSVHDFLENNHLQPEWDYAVNMLDEYERLRCYKGKHLDNSVRSVDPR